LICLLIRPFACYTEVKRMITKKNSGLSGRIAGLLLAAAVVFGGCSGSHEETIAGVSVPIPAGMTKSPQRGIAFALPGFGGAQANYEGSIEPEKVVDFYKKELPRRGWQSSAGIVGKGGMLSYTKEGKTLVMMIGSQNGKTSLALMVGGVPR
jgi:hypothetical protein